MSTINPTRHVGVDVFKGHLDICIKPHGETFTVTNDQQGIGELLGHLEQAHPEWVVLEATGKYERPAAAAITAFGIAVAIVNPRQARYLAEAIGRLAKTDKINAEALAFFAAAVDPRPSAVPD
jgi:transposase